MLAGYGHLAPNAAALLEASLQEKLFFVQQDHHIDYPACDHILRELQDLVAYPPTLRPPCRAVVADSGNGKTTLTRQFVQKNPIVLDEAGYPIAKVLWVETPATADEGRLFSAILGGLGINHRADAQPERLESLVHQEMAAQQTSVLVLDELHAMLNGAARQQKQFMASLKRLANMRQLSIIASGTTDITRALATDPQFVSRFTRLALPKWLPNEDFLKLVKSFESLLPFPKPSNFHAPKLAQLIYMSGNQTIGSVRRITLRAAELALKEGQERVTFEMLERACVLLRAEDLGSPAAAANS